MEPNPPPCGFDVNQVHVARYLYVPESLSDAEIDDLIRRREYQIHKYLAKQALLNEHKTEREPVNGQSFLYLGRNYYLQFSSEVRDLRLKGKYFYAPEEQRDRLPDLLRDFYRKQGKVFMSARAHAFADKMGLHLKEVSILELKNRWASCSVKKAKLNFHWKAMMAPVSVIEYLIVHELAHLKYPRHDSAFWNEVDKIVPKYQEKVGWLKRYGASLTI